MSLNYLRKNSLSGIHGIYNLFMSFLCMNGEWASFCAILIHVNINFINVTSELILSGGYFQQNSLFFIFMIKHKCMAC